MSSSSPQSYSTTFLIGLGLGVAFYLVHKSHIFHSFAASGGSAATGHHSAHHHAHKSHTGRADEGDIMMAQGENLGPKFGS